MKENKKKTDTIEKKLIGLKIINIAEIEINNNVSLNKDKIEAKYIFIKLLISLVIF
jgi:hypothetical protein